MVAAKVVADLEQAAMAVAVQVVAAWAAEAWAEADSEERVGLAAEPVALAGVVATLAEQAA